MNISMNIAAEPLLALVIGILILLVPRFLNYFVAVYLIVVGILGLMHTPSPEEVIMRAKATPFFNSFQFNVFPLTGALPCQLAQSYS